MGATACSALAKRDHPFLLLLCLHHLEEQHEEGRGSTSFVQHWICCSRKQEQFSMQTSLQHDLRLPALLKEDSGAGRKLNCSLIAL